VGRRAAGFGDNRIYHLDIFQGSKLNAKLAALTALDYASPRLKVHIPGALNVACSRDEITEAIFTKQSRNF
jgi:hypothetical protein